MRHTDDGITFDESWQRFKEGFGNLSATHWVGNEYIHALTKDNDMEAKVEVIDVNNTKYIGKYSQFMVGSEEDKYQLTISGFQTSNLNFRNELKGFNGQKFATFDNEKGNKCHGVYGNIGWWRLTTCQTSCPTGVYLKDFADNGNTWGQSMKVKHFVLKIKQAWI